MKKAFRLFAVALAVSFVLLTAGTLSVKKDSVNYGEIYDHFAKLVNVGQSDIQAELPQRADISSFKEITDDDYVVYQLNEFNTIELYLQGCNAELREVEGSDKLIISYDYPSELNKKTAVHTAVKGGTLFVQNEFKDDNTQYNGDISVTINIPDSFKGGYTLNGENCVYILESPESAMNFEMNIVNSSVTAGNITAENVSVKLNDSKADIERITSEESVLINAVSSQITLNGSSAVYTTASASSSALNIFGINGSFNLNSDFSRVALDFSNISGNLQLDLSKTQADVSIPKNTDAVLRYDGSYSSLKNNTSLRYADEENKNNLYFVETYSDFSIVSFAEK